MCGYTFKYIHTFKYIQELYAPGCAPGKKNASPGYAPGMYVSVHICKYMQVFVCVSLYIHVYVGICRYSICIYTYLHVYAIMANYKSTGR